MDAASTPGEIPFLRAILAIWLSGSVAGIVLNVVIAFAPTLSGAASPRTSAAGV